MRIIHFLLFCTCTGLLPADQITLKNGDVITGAIVKKDGGKLTIKSEFLGEVTVPWEAVIGIKSDDAVTVALPGDRNVSGKVSTEGNQIRIDAAGSPQSAPLAEVAAIRDTAEQKSMSGFRPRVGSTYGRAISIWDLPWLAATRARQR